MNEEILKKFEKEVYISVDVETNGPYPGDFSMINLGASSFKLTNPNPLEPISAFSVNIRPLRNAKQDPDTMRFWAKHPGIWKEINKNRVSPKEAMDDFEKWIANQPGKPAFVGYPGGFDFLFVYWYMMKFRGSCPFSFRNLGIATMAFTMLKTPFRGTVKRKMPKRWFEGCPAHDHAGLSDSIGQGMQFMHMLIENLEKPLTNSIK